MNATFPRITTLVVIIRVLLGGLRGQVGDLDGGIGGNCEVGFELVGVRSMKRRFRSDPC